MSIYESPGHVAVAHGLPEPCAHAEFVRRVRDALANLYDVTYLQNHPLAAFVRDPGGVRSSGAGHAVQHALHQAIDSLRPDPVSAQGGRIERRSQILRLRYVEGLDPPAVQDRLGIGKSHYYREHERALEAVVAVLAEQWLVGRPKLGEIAAPESADKPPNNLPAELTSFVGRDAEIPRLIGLLDRTRLLTVTGAGGSGKSRLALRIAREVLDRYPDGVWLVELASLTDTSQVPQAVAAAVGIRESAEETLTATLGRFLRDKRLLLLFDNCEHLVEASAKLADTLLRAGSRVRLLATSREALGLPGEVSWRVPSLATPPSGQDLPVDELLRIASVRLFVDRATAADPGFVVTTRNAGAVAEICRRLDGIPLALELASARLKGLSIAQIATRLDQCYRLLTGGSRAAPRRQQTLAAAVGWSYDLLTAAERRLFDRLAVFLAGFTLEAAEAVCANDRIEAREVLDLLAALVEKSLVIANSDGQEGTRYRLLETLRQFAWAKLAERGEADRVRIRHATYYLAFTERNVVPADAFGWGQPLEAIEAQLGNIGAALRWSVESNDAQQALRVGGHLANFWYRRGYPAEGRAWLAELLATPAVAGGTADRAATLIAAAALDRLQCKLEVARSLLDEALAIYRERGDQLGIGRCLEETGWVECDRSNYSAARRHLEEALGIARQLEHRELLAYTLHNLSKVFLAQGDYPLAESLQQESLEITGREAENGARLDWLGHIAVARGDYPRARGYYAEGLTLRKRAGRVLGVAYTLAGWANLASAEGHHTRAARLIGAAAQLCDESGVPRIRVQEAGIRERLEVSRQVMGADAYDVAWAEGQAMAQEQAIAYALAEDPGEAGEPAT